MARTLGITYSSLALATLILLLLSSTPSASAQQPSVYTSGSHQYLGCYHETTDIPNTNGARALNDGKAWVVPGSMTVPMCLDFCGGGSGDVYKFAGLEYSRECWCGQMLNGLSTKFDDSACDLQCDGNATQLCGGRMMLSVYLAASNPAISNISTMGSDTGVTNVPPIGGGVRMGSSSTNTVVTSWLFLLLTAVVMINGA